MQVSQKFNKLNDLDIRIPVSIFLITCTSSSQKLDEVVFTVLQAKISQIQNTIKGILYDRSVFEVIL